MLAPSHEKVETLLKKRLIITSSPVNLSEIQNHGITNMNSGDISLQEYDKNLIL
jgi:hypothetical protein